MSAEADWPQTEEEYGIAHFTMLLCVLLLLLLIDAVSRWLTRQLEDDYTAAPSRERRARQLQLLVWSRLQGELTVVATLPLMSWLFSRTGLFDRLAELARRWPRIEIETPEAVTEAATWIAPSFSCHPRMPPDAASMLLLVNDVCFALLLTVLFYFGFIALVLHTLQQWLTAYERLEAGSPPLNPAEHFAMRQLDAMRAQLLSALRAEPRAQHKLESDAKLKTTVESGSLYVSHFIGDVGHAQLKILVDFTPSTWAIMEAYFLVLGGALFFCACWRSLTLFFDVLWCADSHTPLATHVPDVPSPTRTARTRPRTLPCPPLASVQASITSVASIRYGATIYLGWRLLLHGSILRQIERDRLSRHREDGGGFLRTGWPHEWIDRLLFFVVGPGVTGFRPWAAPSAPVGCRCIQARVRSAGVTSHVHCLPWCRPLPPYRWPCSSNSIASART